MDKSRKFALKLLKYLERIFPNDQANSSQDCNFEYDGKVITTLINNGLIEEVIYKVKGLPSSMGDNVGCFRITSKGIEFLNGLKQKTTNRLLIALTVILTLIGIIQIVVMIVK